MPHAFPTRRSSDLRAVRDAFVAGNGDPALQGRGGREAARLDGEVCHRAALLTAARQSGKAHADLTVRSEEHTSALQSLMRISYAVFCLKKNTIVRNQLLPRSHNRASSNTNN